MRLRFVFLTLLVAVGVSVGGGSASAATVCTGDICVVTGGFAGLQADIAGSGAPAQVTRALAGEVGLSQAFHPPNPCAVTCVPSFGSLASEYLLVLVDYQVGVLSGLLPRAGCPGGCTFPGCPGGCSFPPASARVIDGDIRALFADPTMTPPGPPTLPAFISITTT